MDGFINLKLLSHPLNWLIVWSVLLFAGAVFMLGHEQIGIPLSNTEA